jgi:hypothetical protein
MAPVWVDVFVVGVLAVNVNGFFGGWLLEFY